MVVSHYIPKNVSDVSTKDSRVSLIGTVANAAGGSFILEDDTGKIELTSEFHMERNQLVRAFCSVVDEKLKADIVQDMNGFDVDLFKKISELYNRAGV